MRTSLLQEGQPGQVPASPLPPAAATDEPALPVGARCRACFCTAAAAQYPAAIVHVQQAEGQLANMCQDGHDCGASVLLASGVCGQRLLWGCAAPAFQAPGGLAGHGR